MCVCEGELVITRGSQPVIVAFKIAIPIIQLSMNIVLSHNIPWLDRYM